MKSSELKRSTPLDRGARLSQRKTFQASPAQRAKVKEIGYCAALDEDCFGPLDPAHICPRSQGGDDDPRAIVPLCREHHRRFDNGLLDLQPFLIPRYAEELSYALKLYRGDLIALLQRTTGERWQPVGNERKVASG